MDFFSNFKEVHNIFFARLILLGSEFHKAANDVSIIRLPYRIVFILFGTSDVHDADFNVLDEVHVHQWKSSHIIWCRLSV